MGGEPWCFPPATIARLTDYQIHHVYVLPAAERARREAGEERVGPSPASLADTPEGLVAFYVGMGMTEATARRMAAEQLEG
jgi:hypothetical protein